MFPAQTTAFQIAGAALGCLLLYTGVALFIAADIGLDPFTGVVMVIRDKVKGQNCSCLSLPTSLRNGNSSYKAFCSMSLAMTNCTVVKISRVMFEKWMYSDIRAMKYEAKQVGEYLLEEGRNSRLFLFMQGADRLALLLVENLHFETFKISHLLQIDLFRHHLLQPFILPPVDHDLLAFFCQ